MANNKNLYKDILVLLIAIILIIFLYKVYGFTEIFIAYSFLVVLLIIIAIIDIKEKIIPNKIIILGMIIGTIFLFINKEISILSRVFGALISGGIFAGISVLTRGALGMGDAKLASMIGLFVGLWDIMATMFLASIASGIVGIFLIIKDRNNKNKTIPFAPFILLGLILTMFSN